MHLYREDHPLNVKRGGVCIAYKTSLPLKIKNIHYLQECINFEIKIKDKHEILFHYATHLTKVKMIFSHLLITSNLILIQLSATNLNSDLSKINAWVNQWKMTFNPAPNKQPQEVTFSHKTKKISHPPLNFSNNSVQQVQF